MSASSATKIQATSVRGTSSPAKVIARIVQNRMTGRLTLTDAESGGIYWRIYIGQGKLHFAENTTGARERLEYILKKHVSQLELPAIPLGDSAYTGICNLWRSEQLTLQEVRQLLSILTEEALTQLLSIPQATIQFERKLGLDPILLNLPIGHALGTSKTLIGRWRNIRNRLPSPLMRIQVKEPEALLSSLALVFPNVLNDKQTDFLSLFQTEQSQPPSLYSVAKCLDVDVLDFAEAIYPLATSDIFSLSPYKAESTANKSITIACIDDSKAVQRKVKLTMESAGYKVCGLTEPARAITALARHRPSLILLDITMPELNGYELCGLLRQSAMLKQVPIVMLTGRDGAIDRLRARMAGASDYITKPFNPQELLARVQQYVEQASKT